MAMARGSSLAVMRKATVEALAAVLTVFNVTVLASAAVYAATNDDGPSKWGLVWAALAILPAIVIAVTWRSARARHQSTAETRWDSAVNLVLLGVLTLPVVLALMANPL